MHKPAPASANRHQPNTKLINIRRGEGGEAGKGGPLWSPASCSLCSPMGATLSHPHHRATIKAHSTSTQPPSPLRIIRPPVSLPGLACYLLGDLEDRPYISRVR